MNEIILVIILCILLIGVLSIGGIFHKKNIEKYTIRRKKYFAGMFLENE